MNKENTHSKVGIQGVKGAFHEIAARTYFGDKIELVECISFEKIIDLLAKKQIDFGLMAIENTVAGSIIPNYTLIREAPVKIVGEEYIRIVQNLIGLPGQKIEDITEVHSHYMAIAQCREFLSDYPNIKLIESEDTALSIKEISDWKIKNRAGIASELAANIYGMEVLAREIETNKKNYTRFLVLSHESASNVEKEQITKASLCFNIPHQKASLASILSVLAFYDLDLTKIQSMPLIGQAFHYLFYVDVTFTTYEKYQKALEAIKPLIQELKILGEYKYSIETLETIHQQ